MIPDSFGESIFSKKAKLDRFFFIIYYCIINYPKLSSLNISFCFSHDLMGRKLRKDSVGVVVSDLRTGHQLGCVSQEDLLLRLFLLSHTCCLMFFDLSLSLSASDPRVTMLLIQKHATRT